jgi:hypothetical protein
VQPPPAEAERVAEVGRRVVRACRRARACSHAFHSLRRPPLEAGAAER